ncbi:MAG: DUF1269 domain-containing protein [Cyanobacteriota bacterium]
MTTTPRAYGRNQRAVGVFKARQETEHALHELRDAGFDMNKVSVITRDANDSGMAGADVRDQHGNKADEGAATGAVTGGVLGGITGLLVGLGTLAIPGVGPILLAGAEATAIATTLAGTAIGAAAGGLIGALVGLGIPEERAKVYSDRVSRGEYLVMVTGTEADIRRATAILSNRGVEELGVYDAPDLGHERTEHVAHMNNAVVERKTVERNDVIDCNDVKYEDAVECRDIDHDNQAEVIIIDHRDEARKVR